MNKNIVIVGGGMSGLTMAYYLTKLGEKVTIIEKEDHLGGNGACWETDDFWIDYYYHFFLKSDKYIMALLKELGLENEIIWKDTDLNFFSKSNTKFLAFLSEKGIMPFSSGRDIFQNGNLSLANKFLLGYVYLRLRLIRDWKQLEGITARDWVMKVGNDTLYKEIFEPLLNVKWGGGKDTISASWLWARIRARVNAEGSFKFEKTLGCLKGASRSLFLKLEEKIINTGGILLKNSNATKIIIKDNAVNGIEYETKGRRQTIKAKRVVSTIPLPNLIKIATLPREFNESLQKVKYCAVICACLCLKKPLTNIVRLVCRPDIASFNGIVEHTNIVSPKYYNNQSIIYLFRFLNAGEKMWRFSDSEILENFLRDMRRLLPKFEDNSLIWSRIQRNSFADPIYDLNYTKKIPGIHSPVEGLSLVELSQALPVSDYNNIIRLCIKASKAIGSDLRSGVK